MIILNSSNPKGSCYIETKNLDGETNLKMKSAKKELYEYFRSKEDLNNFSGELICEEPNDQIYKFEGAIQYRKD
jgi:magnesium-transporting ATPase (P-type)